MTTVTITSQGQITIPASVRKQLGLQGSDKLHVSVNPATREIRLNKPVPLDQIADRFTSLIKPGTPPVTNVDEYYQKHRGETIR